MNYYNFSGKYEHGGGVMGGMPAETGEEVRDTILSRFPDVRDLKVELTVDERELRKKISNQQEI